MAGEFTNPSELAIKHKREIRNRVLKWFDSKERDLPWLIKKTPYHIWVSEIMLQQTQIVTVVDYYKRFIRRFPNVKRLAAANVDDVLKLWEGLGYYRRARQMHLAANKIAEHHTGKFPTIIEDVLELPGIGRYTAAAILSISLDQPHAILEGNTIRLFSRLMLLKDDVTTSKSQKRLWEFSERLLPIKRVGDFNQALMDFGREVCKPKNPDCVQCPLSNCCPARILGEQTVIPVKGKKIQYEDLHEAVIWIERRGKILMRKCQPGERWAGLWDFPRYGQDANAGLHQLQTKVKEQTGLSVSMTNLQQTINHAVTKYRIRLDCYKSSRVHGRLRPGNFCWKTKTELQSLPLSATGRKIAKLVLK